MMLEACDIPRCEAMDGTGLTIVPAYTEAGYFQEANAVTLTDGTRTAIYAPVRTTPTPPLPESCQRR